MKRLQDIVSCVSDYDPNALPVAQAQAIVKAFVSPVEAVERVAVRASLGRVLANDIVSPIDVPSHDNAAMDGYAFRGADLAAHGPTTLRVVGRVLAGGGASAPPGAHECVRIMTGAVMPEGTDTVVPQEFCRVDGDRISFEGRVRAGDHRRVRGEDLARGRPALHAGRLVRPADLGLIASLGLAEVSVRRRVRVAFFSTGDELKSLGETLGPGQVYDSNRYTLWGMLERLGVDVLDLGVVRDDPVELERVFRSAAAQADAVVTSGGVSVGEADHTKQIMASLGEVAFWTIAMRPGRPMAFGRVWADDARGDGRSAVVFGLPGNPVAVMVTFYFFVRHALRQMQGAVDDSPITAQATSLDAIRKKPGRTEYQRAIVERDASGTLTVRLTGQQGSGVLRSMSVANAFAVLPDTRSDIAPGDVVDVVLFDGLV